MRILVATASRHGATHEIGQWLGDSISAGMRWRDVAATVDIIDVADIDDLRVYDAIVLGSAVYMGRWLKSAREVADQIRDEMTPTPVWLFSSGPVAQNGTNAVDAPPKATWAVEHRTFCGKLDRSTLSWFERLVVTVVKARDGDDRPRADIEAWGESICTAMSATTPKYSAS